ncbi:MAG: squalene/phytoene synthase family protein [Nodosilinea sp.]
MAYLNNALSLLKATSRTFFIPISLLPAGLQEAVTSAYLCMRAIDQIEDHPGLDNALKAKLLRSISFRLQAGHGQSRPQDFAPVPGPDLAQLEEVSLRIGEWALLAPPTIAPRIWDATAAMADRMASWADCNWQVNTEADLDCYTFSVAGAVGLLLSDLWAWHDNTQTSRAQAIGFGRGLQSVNILRNYQEDRGRGVDFFPDGWGVEDMQHYAHRNLALGEVYTKNLAPGPAKTFCSIPLALAQGTLEALSSGREKLSRDDVISIISKLVPLAS